MNPLHPMHSAVPARGRLLVLCGALFVSAVAVGGWVWWWRGRPARHLAEATRCLRLGNWAEAGSWLELPEMDPRTRESALLVRARVALAEGRPEAAVSPLREIRPDGPNSAEAAYLKGWALQEVGNTPLAIAWLKTALRGRPRDPEILRRLAAAAYDLGDRDTVMTALKTLTKTCPEDPRGWRTLGLVTLEEPGGGEIEREFARQAYERSLRLDPGQPRVRLELAEILVLIGRFDEAERQLHDCAGHVPEAERAYLRSRVAWGRGDLEQCEEIVEAGLKHARTHPGLLAQRGLLTQSRGRLSEAIEWFDGAVAADPHNPEWVYMRAIALRALGRADDADRDRARAAELKQAVVTMSRLNAEAADHPTDAGVRVQIGHVCERLGKPELAASWYRAALACDPRSADALAALRALAAGRGRPHS